MPELPFKVDDPPARPPVQCANPLLWNLAYQLFRDHRADGDGFCITCMPDEFSPCIGRYLAVRGFLVSCGAPDPALIKEVP